MLDITVANERQERRLRHGPGPLELGRSPGTGVRRLVLDDPYVSRNQLRLHEQPDGRLRVENMGAEMKLSEGPSMARGESRILTLPITMSVGDTTIAVQLAAAPQLKSHGMFQTLARVDAKAAVALSALGESPAPDTLARWFETVLSVQRAAAGSTEFYDETAHAVVDLVGLDRGLVLLRRGDEWEIAGRHSKDDKSAGYSRYAIKKVVEEKQTFFQAHGDQDVTASLMEVEAVVASPVFGADESVVGVVYGSRDSRSLLTGREIQPLEAQVVQLLAGAVSAGLARMEREAEAARIRVKFESFFSPQLARELERDPNMLEATDRQVTVLFADLRGFSRISERLGTRETYRLVRDVMDRLTQAVMDTDGVIIDYYGDGLAAMWNAPTDQSDHAVRACRAGLAIQDALPVLNEAWNDIIGTPLRVGVGIDSGIAQVGNAGSSRRLKYGPRGHTVNLASRIEGATKVFGVPILISGNTRGLLTSLKPRTRRLCQARLVGMRGTVELCELSAAYDEPGPAALRDRYEQSLDLVDAGRLDEARQLLNALQSEPWGANDAALGLVLKQIETPSEPFDSVIELTSK